LPDQCQTVSFAVRSPGGQDVVAAVAASRWPLGRRWPTSTSRFPVAGQSVLDVIRMDGRRDDDSAGNWWSSTAGTGSLCDVRAGRYL